MSPVVTKIDPISAPIQASLGFQALASRVGAPAARWMLRVTAHIESRSRMGLVSRTGAEGAWQILPSTQRRLWAARATYPFPLPQWHPHDPVVQSQYALAHMVGDHAIFMRKGPPPIVKLLFPLASPQFLMLASMRYYYHNGPSHSIVPGHEADIRAALVLFARLFDSAVAGTGDPI